MQKVSFLSFASTPAAIILHFAQLTVYKTNADMVQILITWI